MNRLGRMFVQQRRSEESTSSGYAAHVTPPPRDHAPVTARAAATIPAVHRALQILATSAMQLSIDVERAGTKLTPAQMPPWIRRPNLQMSRSEFVEQLVLALAGHGNAYIMREGGDTLSETVQLTPIPPQLVTPWRDNRDRVWFAYDGQTYGPDRIRHIRYLALPGQLLGIGPIQAAQTTMASAADMREYSAQWWNTGQPSGILQTDSALTADEANLYRNAWNLLDADGRPIPQSANPSRVRVIGKGLTYTPLLINPKDALWIDAQKFDTLEIARIFGVPASLMLTAVESSSMTYQNIEQEWIGYVRFGLMSYLRKIEDALTDLTPNGQTVRFNLETLLRTDTASRYAAYATAITAGFATVNEVRALEHMPPLPDTASKPNTAAQETAA